MNIHNFEDYINQTILDRGYDYYQSGNIVEVTELGDNGYLFEVEGYDFYEVIVTLNQKGDILTSDCDCPYDYGPVCKHEAAVYYELADMLDSKKSKAQQPALQDILHSFSKEELITIIQDLAKKDAVLRNSLMVKHMQGGDLQDVKQYQRLIESIVRKYTGRDGYIPYRDVYDFASEMEELLQQIEDDAEGPLQALDLAVLLLEESIEAFQYADDSNGDIGYLVSEVMSMISRIAESLYSADMRQGEKAFRKLLHLVDHQMFQGWDDYQIETLEICIGFAGVAAFRNELKMKIGQLIQLNSKREYGRYRTENMLQMLFAIAKQYGTKEEAEQLMKENLVFPSFRKALIGQHMQAKKYDMAIEAALEGEEQDRQYPGLVSDWKKLRYAAYKELSMKKEQEGLAWELLLGGDFVYYRELKELASDQETFYQQAKRQLKTSKSWQARSLYVSLIVEEKDLSELLAYVKENPDEIERYADMLVDEFNDEVIEVYKQYIQFRAKVASNRSDYQRVCGVLQRYEKIAGEKDTSRIVNELSLLYKRKPAFLDELSKI